MTSSQPTQPLTEDEREHMNLLLTPQLRKIATGEHDASDAQRELARLLVAERERDSLARRCERYFRDLEQARTELSRLRAENTAQAARIAAGRAVLTDRIAKWKAQQEVWQNMPTSTLDRGDLLRIEFEQHRLGEVEDVLDEFDAAFGLVQDGEGQANA